MRFLSELTLRDNPWSCDWEFGPVFQKWLIKHYKMVSDIEQIYCMDNMIHISLCTALHGPNSRESGRRVINNAGTKKALIYIDFSTDCHNPVKSITEVVSLAVAFAAFMVIVLVVSKNLLLIHVYLYNQFGVRFHREDNDNTDRPYDIFVTYAKQDAEFVLQNLLAELETGDKSYKVGTKLFSVFSL